MNVLDLFSGIGGFSLGLERAGMRTIAFCEIDPYCRTVLRKHWPHVPIYDDVRTLPRIAADVVCGGFPCQDISIAGVNAGHGRPGIDGERSGLWTAMARVIGDVRPCYALMENVAALLSGDDGRWLGRVLGDLAEIGYDAEWHCIPASAIGAPHQRDRIWIIAYPHSEGVEGPRAPLRLAEAGAWGWRGQRDLQAIADAPFEPRVNRWPQPVLRGMDDGVFARVDRLHALGNSIVPQIAQLIGEAIVMSHRTDEDVSP